MTKIFILVVHTKLMFNLVYNGLKRTFYSVTLCYKGRKEVSKHNLYGENEDI